MTYRPFNAKSIFLAAIEKSPDQRAECVRTSCGDDEELRRRVQELLDAHANLGNPPSRLPGAVVPTIAQPAAEQPGTYIGPYKLVEEIGEGGMGAVFMALQKEPVRRTVALKIIKPGMDSKQVVSRFEAERQALAMMDHPNIAKVFDGGVTDAGRPYFVMELVKGIPITDYCDRDRLTTDQRLELFNDVCRAVQHAHRKGIIHRDLKPSNILVTRLDEKATPKVIDFGVAKAISGHLMDGSLVTAYLQLVGTPMYMSPEQAEPNAVDVDTRSDVYALGVLLYELLTGTTPFDRERMSSVSFDELRRIVREEDPPRPSIRLSTLAAALDTVADKHHTDPRTLFHEVAGELDWIVMKALEKDRSRRYESANELAKDIQRYLRDEPVEACPPSAMYRFGKIARRNKTGLGATVSVSLALITGMSLALWQARAAREATARAEMDNDRAQKTLCLALDTVDEIYSTVADERFRNQPMVDPLKVEVLAKTRTFYEALVQVNPTDSQLQQRQAHAYKRLGHLHEGLGDYLRADVAYGNATVLFQELADAHPSEAEYRLELGNCYVSRGWVRSCSDRKAEAIVMLDQAVMILTELVATAPLNPEYTSAWTLALCMRGLWYYDSGRPHESLDDSRTAFQAQKPIVAAFPNKPWYRYLLAGSYHNHAQSLAAERRFEEADRYFYLALEGEQRVLQDEPADPAFRWQHALTHERLAAALASAQKWEEAAIVCRQSNELHQRVTTDFPKTPVYRMSYVTSLLTSADVMTQLDDWIAVDQNYRLVFEQAETMVALSDQDVRFCGTWAHACRKCADFFMSTQQHKDAEKLYRTMLGRLEKLITGAPSNIAYRGVYMSSILNMSMLLASGGGYDEAMILHEHAVGVLDDAIAALADENVYSDKDRGLAQNHLAWLLSATPLETLRDPVESLLIAHEAARLDPGGHTWNTLGLACYRAGQYCEAIDALNASINTSAELLDDCRVGYNAFPLAMVYQQLGDEQEARDWYDIGAERMDQDILQDPGQMLLRREAAALLGVAESERSVWHPVATFGTRTDEPVESSSTDNELKSSSIGRTR